jgi:hypothetical protein
MTDVRRPEKACWICLDQHFLRALRRGAPRAQTVVVVVVGSGREQLSGDKPCRLPMALPLRHLGQGEAELSKPLDFGGIAWSVRGVGHKSRLVHI